MCFIYFSIVLVFIGCSQSKQVDSSPKVVVNNIATDSIINALVAQQAPSAESLNWTNLVQLMNSLGEIPQQQRSITLKTIKNEATNSINQSWSKQWDIDPIRSRYNVFVTHVSLAADQRYGDDAPLAQAQAIVRMKQSWNIFVSHLETKESSAIFETAPR